MEVKDMIQNILPQKIDIDFKERPADQQDYILVINEEGILVNCDEDKNVKFPRIMDIQTIHHSPKEHLMYLFSVDHGFYYLYIGDQIIEAKGDYIFMNRRGLYETSENVYGYIGVTASHINGWYLNNKFCGKCGKKMSLLAGERTLSCASCNNIVYPRINPVVIVGIRDGDKLLLTKYANSNYDRYALVAGFVEVGESFEDTVRREVLEEVGLKVKNISYFDSQPWGISGGLLAGYFADLEGDNKITLDLEELKEGTWVTKETMPKVYENEKSLTRTMMYHWYKGQ